MIAEHALRPALLLVHDPTPSLQALAEAKPEENLFRVRPDPERYAEEHAAFVATLRAEGVEVRLLRDVVGDTPEFAATASLPNQVFTRDSLLTLPWAPGCYLGARMRPPQRRAETATLAEAARRLGLTELARLPESVYVEGGDVIPFSRNGRRTLIVGHGARTSRTGVRALADALLPEHADEILAIRLADWRLNLDGGFLPVAEDVLLAETGSLLDTALLDVCGEQAVELAELGLHLVEVTREESLHAQACNAVCLGDRRVVMYDLCERVAKELAQRDVEVVGVPGRELVKGRGGPRCMTRPIYARLTKPA